MLKLSDGTTGFQIALGMTGTGAYDRESYEEIDGVKYYRYYSLNNYNEYVPNDYGKYEYFVVENNDGTVKLYGGLPR